MSYRVEWIVGAGLWGLLLLLLVVPGLAVVALVFLTAAALAVLPALVVGVLALPYLLVRAVRANSRHDSNRT